MGVALAHFVRLANIMTSWPEQIAKIVNFRNLIQIRDPRILVHAVRAPKGNFLRRRLIIAKHALQMSMLTTRTHARRALRVQVLDLGRGVRAGVKEAAKCARP